MSNAVPHSCTRVPRVTELAESARRRARGAGLSVVPRRRTRAPRVPFVTVVTLILVGGVIGLLLFNTSMQQAAFAATKLEDQAALLAAREQTLLLELENLRDPQRVARLAVEQGMVPASSAAFLHLSDGQVVGTPTPAEAADGVRIDARPTPRTGALVAERQVVRTPVTTLPGSAGAGDTASGSPGSGTRAGSNERGTTTEQGERDARLD